MQAEFLIKMNQSKMDFFKKIKSNENPNPFNNRVEEKPEKTEAPAIETVAPKPLLSIERVFEQNVEKVVKTALTPPPSPVQQIRSRAATDDENDDEDDAIMENIGAVRIRNFLDRCYEGIVRAFNYWFELAV